MATSSDGTLARSVQYAMWKREIETLEGMFEWSRADNLDQFVAAVKKVRWNENVTYADADGHIMYWHPGLYPRRHPEVDQRLAVPGTGAFDWRGLTETKDMPHVIDPRQGWLANWNNKPAQDFVGAVSPSTPVPYGAGFRVRAIFDRLSNNPVVSFKEMQQLEREWGTADYRAWEFVPLLVDLRRTKGLDETQAKVLELLEDWSGSIFGGYPKAALDPGPDGPAPTIFDAFLTDLRQELFAGAVPPDVFTRESRSPSHLYEMETLDNLALRILNPRSSSLRVHHDWLGGRSPTELVESVFARTLERLQEQYGSDDPADFRRDHAKVRLCTLTGGVVGPGFEVTSDSVSACIQHALRVPGHVDPDGRLLAAIGSGRRAAVSRSDGDSAARLWRGLAGDRRRAGGGRSAGAAPRAARHRGCRRRV